MNRGEQIDALIKTARSLIGAPYKYGSYLEEGSDKQSAFDCSSFMQFIFKKIGVDLPRSTILQAAANGKEISVNDIQAGDLLFFEGERGHYRHDLFPNRKIYIGHVALYIGDNKIIHATNSNGFSGVVEHDLRLNTSKFCNINTVVLAKRYF